MNKSTTSILMATMIAFSGFAAAQTADVKAGTQGGAGPTGASGYGDNKASVTDRAAVKAEIMPQKAGIQGGSGATATANPNTTKAGAGGSVAMAPKMTSAERKAQRAQARAARKARLAGTAGNTPMKSGQSSN